MFDIAPSHKKYPSDGLNLSDMNVHPGGKHPLMKDTSWNGTHQSMVLRTTKRNKDCPTGERHQHQLLECWKNDRRTK